MSVFFVPRLRLVLLRLVLLWLRLVLLWRGLVRLILLVHLRIARIRPERIGVAAARISWLISVSTVRHHVSVSAILHHVSMPAIRCHIVRVGIAVGWVFIAGHRPSHGYVLRMPAVVAGVGIRVGAGNAFVLRLE